MLNILYMSKLKFMLALILIFAWIVIWLLIADRVEDLYVLSIFMGQGPALLLASFVGAKYGASKRKEVDDEMQKHIRGWASEKALIIMGIPTFIIASGLTRAYMEIGHWASDVGWALMTLLTISCLVWCGLFFFKSWRMKQTI